MEARSRSWWKYIRLHRLLRIGIIATLIVLAVFILAVWMFGWGWTGFNGGYSQITTTSTSHGTTTTIVKPPGKTLWDLLQLLGVLAIPVVVGFGAARYTRIQQLRDREHEKLQHKRDQETAKIQHDRDLQLADQRAESERKDAEERARLEHEIASDNQCEAALQIYIDKMSELLLHEKLRSSTQDEEVRKIARVRTWAVLSRLDARRKRSVLQFLDESNLIDKDEVIIDLSKADLSKADLSGAELARANLEKVNLSKADLSKARLFEANLREADLRKANLQMLF